MEALLLRGQLSSVNGVTQVQICTPCLICPANTDAPCPWMFDARLGFVRLKLLGSTGPVLICDQPGCMHGQQQRKVQSSCEPKSSHVLIMPSFTHVVQPAVRTCATEQATHTSCGLCGQGTASSALRAHVTLVSGTWLWQRENLDALVCFSL